MANTTWNPADKSATMTLSGGNLIATGSSSIAWVRAVDKKTTGKFYWEYKATVWSNSNSGLGFCPSGLASPNLASGAGLCAVYATGIIFTNGTNVGTLGTRSPGDVIGIALDVGAQLAWFRVAPSGNWNGSGTANPATGTGGLSLASITNVDDCPLVGFFPGIGESATANFGDSAFSGAVPSGFTTGWPTNAPPPIELAGNLGAPSHYGKLSYGKVHYSRISAFAPIFVADLDVHVGLIDLAGDIAPQIALGGSLSLNVPLTALEGSFGVTVALGASSFVSGPLWTPSEPPPSLWTPTEPCDPVEWKESTLCNG